MNSVTQDILEYLQSQSIGTVGTDLFGGIMPDTPDACVSAFDTSGFKPEMRYQWERPGLQILVRAAKGGYRTAFTKADSIYQLLHGLTNTTVNSAVYKCITAVSTPISIGEDEKSRPMFSINFEVQRTSA